VIADHLIASLVSYTGVTKTTVPSSSSNHSFVNSEKQRNWKGLFLKAHPEFTAAPPVGRTEDLSSIITTVTETCEPQVSALLDFGYAIDLENDRAGVRARTVPVAVVASGENGNILNLLRVENELVDWEQEEGRKMRVPSIGNVETAKWAGSAAPIRQIRFSQPVEEPAGWLAVRLPLSTIIFRPLLHRDRRPIRRVAGADELMVPAHHSRLDPNPVVEIPISKTGGFAHVNVNFNPWYQRQFGIIDERGEWSIWNISGRQKRLGSETAECVQFGSVPRLQHDGNKDAGNQPQYDGWGAIEWVGSVNKVIVCSRRCTILYVLENDTVLPCPVELGLRRRSEWILDIKRSSSQLSRVFILTTLRILCLDVDSSPVSDGDGYIRSSLSPQLSWQHFRDPEDLTLRLASLSVGEGETSCSIA
jgi:RNA polymerase I-specific transcription initiation factor RRN6